MNKALQATSRPLVAPLPKEEAGAPEWLHLAPAQTFSGDDGRGPYTIQNPASIVTTFARSGRKLPIDENHAIDLIGTKGGASPARGWIVELQARDDGIWGKVEWTAEGRRLVEEREYGFISPVLMHTKQKPYQVGGIARVALTNDPNLTQLKALHSTEETLMDKELRKALGLPEDADDAAVLEAVTTAHAAQTAHVALMARLAEVAGVEGETTPDALVTSLQAKVTAGGDDAEVEDLQAQVKSLNTKLTQVITTGAKKAAELAIDGAIEAGKLVPALRDHMIARHMKNPDEVETELKAAPSLRTGSLHRFKPSDEDGSGLSHEDEQVCAMMGIDPKAYAETAKKLERSAV